MDTPELLELFPGDMEPQKPISASHASGHIEAESKLPRMRQFLLLAIRVVVSLALLYLALRGIDFVAI